MICIPFAVSQNIFNMPRKLDILIIAYVIKQYTKNSSAVCGYTNASTVLPKCAFPVYGESRKRKSLPWKKEAYTFANFVLRYRCVYCVDMSI